ncbi:hypothetical protein [Epilithonimonas sp. UC225_85]|uniref:hypothetical protein n=1 Tax=Epilithonimonas sp. UC225_85 TaxID=3350167 RepID=UPI0036D29259
MSALKYKNNMATCNDKLAKGFLKKCGYKPKAGHSGKYYINFDDIDRAATQLANKNTKVTAIVLKTSAKIYPAEGAKLSKQLHTFVESDFGDGYTHTDEFIVLYRGDIEKENVQSLAEGTRVVTISKKLDGGLNGEITYEVAGLESGMKLKADTYDSSANSGTATIQVATDEGAEATGLKTFLMNDEDDEASLSATETWITTNLWTPTP